MRLGRSAAVGGAAMAGVAAAVHLGPGLPALAPVSDRLAPSLMGRGDPRHVALTFDDGPDPWSTPYFLTLLDDLGWRATFFVLGTMARRSPTLVAEMTAAGHEIGVHGDEHTSYVTRGWRATREDIRRARDSVAELTGVAPCWFRPPYGTLTLAAQRTARAHGLRTVLWTNWGKDWRVTSTSESVLRHILARDVAGGTVLLHDSDCSSAPESWRATIGALPRLADALAARSLVCGPLRDHGIDAGRRDV
jgi:peptidoglycan/xylan/chitin deacetylase (PgdA/CDA1 family)